MYKYINKFIIQCVYIYIYAYETEDGGGNGLRMALTNVEGWLRVHSR